MRKKFKVKPRQTNFRNIRWAPVINCVLEYKNKILIVERNKDMHFYPKCWNGISGFLDDDKGLKEKVFEELKEEVGLNKKDISSVRFGKVFDQDEPKYKKTWIAHPVLVKIKTDRIKLDWEAQNYKWINPREIKKFKVVSGFDLAIKAFVN